jgi:ABC-type transport system substrate-binding protein
MSMPDLIKEIVKVDDYTVKFVLNRPEAPILANLAMDFASVLSAEYADKLDGCRHDGDAEPGSGRHRPVPVRRPTRRTRSSAIRPLPITGAASSRSTT